jgi:hypothetical protein
VLLLGVSLWQVGLGFINPYFKYPMAIVWVGLFLIMLYKAFTTRSILPDNATGASMLWTTPAPTYPANKP